MVILMNKSNFIKKLQKELNYTEDKCIIINDILENNFFISKKNRDKIISEIVIKLDINLEEATKIYELSKKIINEQIKESIKHPFKNKD